MEEELLREGYVYPKQVIAQRARRAREKRRFVPRVVNGMFDGKEYQFVECDTCWTEAKHDFMLCNGCLHNKRVIQKLTARTVSLTGHVEKAKRLRKGSKKWRTSTSPTAL